MKNYPIIKFGKIKNNFLIIKTNKIYFLKIKLISNKIINKIFLKMNRIIHQNNIIIYFLVILIIKINRTISKINSQINMVK